MNGTELKNLLAEIVESEELHAKWLNTLSMMENAGARKIAASEHKTDVDVIVLKHAAEEARHAYYLKSQIKKTGYEGCQHYHRSELLAPTSSYHYLHELDTSISRYLKTHSNLQGHKLRYAAYLLVTYAIEVRADKLYPIYEEVLRAQKSKISVRMIVAEEQGHLEEMIEQMNQFFKNWQDHRSLVIERESFLYDNWITQIDEEVQMFHASHSPAL